MKGRPLRFLGAATLGWVALRTIAVWPDSPLPAPLVAKPAGPAPAAAAPFFIATATAAPMPAPFLPAATPRVPIALPPNAVTPTPPPHQRRPSDPSRVALAMVGLLSPGTPSCAAMTAEGPPQTMPMPGARPAPTPRGSRFSASAWVLVRDGGSPAPGLGGGQLGGGQAGLRIAYALGAARRIALVARLTSPLSGPGREAAIGVEWRPTKLPIRLVAEHRFALDGGKGGPGIAVIGGTGPARIAGGFDLETYGQAGVIRRARTEPYADGAARLTRPLARLGKVRVDLGLGVWGGAQRGAARLDVGPTFGLRAPVGGKTVRLSVEWRQRVAGTARPASGPALSIGSDF